MKASFLFTALLFVITSLPLYATTSQDVISDEIVSENFKQYEGEFSYPALTPINIQMDNFSLIVDSGSLMRNITINLTFLPHKGGHAMPSQMTNVTGIGDGVRLLPNGEHFDANKPALITLSYNPILLPRGYRPDDIYTYFCDNGTDWHRLERVTVDTSAHTVTSLTTHFTDFANAVIKVPEMPESKAFVPTAMTDLPDVKRGEIIKIHGMTTKNL